jgi:hypothetical protein
MCNLLRKLASLARNNYPTLSPATSSHGVGSFVEKLILPDLVKKFPAVMEPKGY